MSVDVSFGRLRGLPEPLKEYAWRADFLQPQGIDGLTDLALHAQSASIPGRNFTEIDKNWVNHVIRTPGKVEKAGNVTVTFFMHNDLLAKNVVEQWHDRIHNNQTGTGRPLSEYAGRLNLDLLETRSGDDVAEELARVELFLVYPGEDQGFDLDYTGDGTPTMDVDFTYSSYDYIGDV